MNDTISFWDNNHPLQETYQKLWDVNVPDSGDSDTVEGELIRAAGRLFYEYCNNGNLNAADRTTELEEETCYECSGDGIIEEEIECSECEGEGCDGCDDGFIIGETDCDSCFGCGYIEEEVEGELEISEFYDYFLNFIDENVPNSSDEVEAVRELILNDSLHYNYNYDQSEMDVYNSLVEKIVKYVVSKEGNFTKMES